MIYFRGCVAREKLNNIQEATEIILNEAGIEYNILENESCCGSFLLRTGFHEDAVETMKEILDKIGDEKILVSCAGCYKTFKKDYPEILDANIDVMHTSQFFNDLIEEKKLKIKQTSEKVTYHDPCHLGRHMEIYDEPRNILNKITDLVEMDRNREKARCCGSGGGVKSAFPEIALDIAKMRVKDANDVGTDIIVTSCPFCMLNIDSACLKNEKILDLSEIIVNAMK